MVASACGLLSQRNQQACAACQVSKNLGNAVRGLSDYSSSKHRRKKNMAGSFMQAMAVASVRNLEQDSLLEPDEDPEQLGNRLLDPTMPEKMMELEQKQRSLAGVPLYQPGWNPEPKEVRDPT